MSQADLIRFIVRRTEVSVDNAAAREAELARICPHLAEPPKPIVSRARGLPTAEDVLFAALERRKGRRE